MACCYDPDCMVWQAFPLALGRQCFHGYKSNAANVTCAAVDPKKKSGMGGGRRRDSPSPAFRTDYSFAGDVSGDVSPHMSPMSPVVPGSNGAARAVSGAVDASWDVVDAPHGECVWCGVVCGCGGGARLWSVRCGCKGVCDGSGSTGAYGGPCRKQPYTYRVPG